MLAAFTAQTRALAATSWLVTGLNNGKSGLVSVLTDSTIGIAFTAERTANGSAGCNRYTAGYLSAGSHLRFSAPATTRRFCAEAGLMDQERMFMNALAAVNSMHLEGGRLEMRAPRAHCRLPPRGTRRAHNPGRPVRRTSTEIPG